MKFATVILAAGRGKRMGEAEIPKVMFPLHGKPMIEHVVETALKIDSEKVVIIVGYKREVLMSYIQNRFHNDMSRIEFAIQEEQLGTGHAVMQARATLEGFQGNVCILSGDTPLLSIKTINKLRATWANEGWTAALISGILENPFGYGRIVRDESGKFAYIREERDTNEAEKAVNEVNSGIYFAEASSLFDALSHIKNHNTQGEYYLTDIFEYFQKHGKSIGAVLATNTEEILGVNTKEQLEKLEKIGEIR